MTVQSLRYELGDTDVGFPIMADAEYQYFLDKHEQSVRRAATDAAKSIMFKLSMRSEETVDIFSIKGSKAAQSYIQALQLYLKNPDLNPIISNAMPYAGGISLEDMQANDQNLDNNIVNTPITPSYSVVSDFFGV